MTDAEVFHLATPQEWDAARASGSVAPPSLATEGFVHCSTGDQIEDTIARHFAGVDELVLLRLRVQGLGEALRWEETRPGEAFPHVYRAIGVDEVVDAVPWYRAGT
jgi:uncharacterized protein (DUF952 family)